MADDKPIIIIKKKGGHGGHHGGAWKVAYADFVTAMMAFFMVMWLINTSDTPVKQAIASYFRKPGIFESGSGTPLLIGESGILEDGYVPPHPEDTQQPYPGKSKELLLQKSGNDSKTSGNKRITYQGEVGKRDSVPDSDVAQRGFQSEEPDNPGLAKNFAIKKLLANEKSASVNDQESKEKEEADQAEQKLEMTNVAAEVKRQLNNSPDLKELANQANIVVDATGLKIEFIDSDKDSMFQSGSAQLTPQADAALAVIAPILATLPNTIDVEGHTDGQALSLRPGSYSNWELSSDRANAARRVLEKYGVAASKIGSVSGRSDRDLKVPTDPTSPANRRVTVEVKFDKNNPAAKKSRPVTQTDQKAPEQVSSAATTPSAAPAVSSAQGSSVAPATSAPKNAADDLPPVSNVTITRRDGKIMLPNAKVPVENAPPNEKDKIFGDNPVIGPHDPFSNLN